ncbi:MAG: zinc-binding protein [Clostridium sp.]
MIYLEIEIEYERIKKLFEGADEKQLELLDGVIIEAARIRVELNDLNKTVKLTGLIKVNPNNLTMQKELPVAKLAIKARANYLNYMSKLSNMLGINIDDDEEELNEYD